jgi:hypothetical protein
VISAERRAAHHCHATGCKTHTAPELLMCRKHWKLVPKALQLAVWNTYRQGQCEDMSPSRAWCEAADAAIQAVALIELERLRRAKEVVVPMFEGPKLCGACNLYHAGNCA